MWFSYKFNDQEQADLHVYESEVKKDLVKKRIERILSFKRSFGSYFYLNYKKITILGNIFKKWKVDESLFFLKDYFDKFFEHFNTPFYTTDRFIDNDEGKIILTLRSNKYVPFFAFHIFKQQPIIPLDQFQYRWPLYIGSKLKLSSFFDLVSHPDHHLEHQLKTLDEIASSGYSAISYVNPSFQSSLDYRVLTLYRAIDELLEKDNVYLLSLDGFDRFESRVLSKSSYVRCDMISLRDLFIEYNCSNIKEKYTAIAAFFGFSTYQMEDEHMA